MIRWTWFSLVAIAFKHERLHSNWRWTNWNEYRDKINNGVNNNTRQLIRWRESVELSHWRCEIATTRDCRKSRRAQLPDCVWCKVNVYVIRRSRSVRRCTNKAFDRFARSVCTDWRDSYRSVSRYWRWFVMLLALVGTPRGERLVQHFVMGSSTSISFARESLIRRCVHGTFARCIMSAGHRTIQPSTYLRCLKRNAMK